MLTTKLYIFIDFTYDSQWLKGKFTLQFVQSYRIH